MLYRNITYPRDFLIMMYFNEMVNFENIFMNSNQDLKSMIFCFRKNDFML